MPKAKSRPKRWEEAALKAEALANDLRDVLEDLKGLQEEYQDWRDNLPENLDTSPVAEKLDAIIDLDLDLDLDAVEEIGNVELPLGFGRD